MRTISTLVALITFAAITIAAQPSHTDASQPAARWWKGNLHTHSFWSDGNDFPEMIAAWYRDHEYNFLALSDHNILSQGERWMSRKTIENRARGGATARYIQTFGEHWVETRGVGDDVEIRLKPLSEFRSRFEEDNRFLMIQSEEITDAFDRLPIHMNVANIQEVIPPQHGESVADTLRNNFQAAAEQEVRTGKPMLLHLDHPNFGWAFTAEDLLDVWEERFFEIFNGHTSTHDDGDAERAGTEEIWDIVNTFRIAKLNAPPLFGLAVDDSHHYHGRQHVAEPGRGWVMVRANLLSPAAIIGSMKSGDFYASTGVTLLDIAFDPSTRSLTIKVEPDEGATFTTYFIGTREGFDEAHGPRSRDGTPIRTTQQYSEDVGVVLASEIGLNPTYTLRGDELYVRAVVASDRNHTDPYLKDTNQKAWTQPVGWRWRVNTTRAVRAATFNIRYDTPSDGIHAWSERKDHVTALIKSFGADIIALQEVLPAQYDFVKAELPDFTFVGGGRDDGKRRGEAAPIAFRTDRFTEIASGMWWLSETPDRPSHGWDAALPRIASWVRLRDRITRKEFLAVSTHFDHRGEQARQESAKLLVDKLKNEPHVILLGDFNAGQNSLSHQTLARSLTDCAADNESATWTGWDGEPDPGRRIDWILHRGFQCGSYEVNPWSDPSHPESDHLPVVVELNY